MGTYYVLGAMLLVSMLSCSTIQFSSEKMKKNIFTICVFVLMIFACLRDITVGKDTQHYVRIFNIISGIEWRDLWKYSLNTGYEIGYVVYNKMLSMISLNTQIITISNSLILMILVSHFIKKECDNPVLGLYVFYAIGLYQSSFNIISSMIASYIVFSGLMEIRNRKLLRYLLYVFIASLFHSAAAVMIILYFVYDIKITGSRIGIVLISGGIITWIFPRIMGIMSSVIPHKYVRYLTHSADNGLILLFHGLLVLTIFIVQLATEGSLQLNDEEDISIHMWSVIFEIVFLFMAMRIDIFTRVAYFFMPSLPIFIDKAIGNIRLNNNRVLLFWGLIIMIGVQYILRLQINNIGGSIPYKFFF